MNMNNVQPEYATRSQDLAPVNQSHLTTQQNNESQIITTQKGVGGPDEPRRQRGRSQCKQGSGGSNGMRRRNEDPNY